MGYNNMMSGSAIDLLDILRIIRKRIKMLFVFVFAVVLVTAIIVSFKPKYYSASAVIMPLSKGSGGLAALSSQFSGLASLVGLGGGANAVTPTQQLMALLRSRTLAEDVINGMDLLPVLVDGEVKTTDVNYGLMMENAVSTLGSHVMFSDDKKGGTITISSEFRDPKLAMDVANYYVEGLQNFINKNALTVAKRNRIFIEKQLDLNKKELLWAGKELNEFYKSDRVSSVESKINIPSSDTELITPPSQFSSEDMSGLEKLQLQKDELDRKLLVKDIPQQVYLQYLTLRRNLLAQVNGLLTQQYEMAKIDEAKDEWSYQVIDSARLPEHKSRPKRTKMVMLAFVSSLLIGMFGVLLIEYVKKMKDSQG